MEKIKKSTINSAIRAIGLDAKTQKNLIALNLSNFDELRAVCGGMEGVDMAAVEAGIASVTTITGATVTEDAGVTNQEKPEQESGEMPAQDPKSEKVRVSFAQKSEQIAKTVTLKAGKLAKIGELPIGASFRFLGTNGQPAARTYTVEGKTVRDVPMHEADPTLAIPGRRNRNAVFVRNDNGTAYWMEKEWDRHCIIDVVPEETPVEAKA